MLILCLHNHQSLAITSYARTKPITCKWGRYLDATGCKRSIRERTATEINSMIRTETNVWMDETRKEDLSKVLKLEPILDTILKWKTKWVQRIDSVSKQTLQTIKQLQTTRVIKEGLPLKRLERM